MAYETAVGLQRYENVSLNISDNQKDKIKRAINNKNPVTIRINPETGSDILALTKTQINKIQKAFEKNKGVDITLSKAQLKHNLKIEGGFLGTLISLAARALPAIASKILPALGIGTLTGLASTGVQKALGDGLRPTAGDGLRPTAGDGLRPTAGDGLRPAFGDGLYLKKGGYLANIQTDGKGIYLGETSPPYYQFDPYGDGLYLKSGNNIYDGKGLLLGENSPFKNIPILGLLL